MSSELSVIHDMQQAEHDMSQDMYQAAKLLIVIKDQELHTKCRCIHTVAGRGKWAGREKGLIYG